MTLQYIVVAIAAIVTLCTAIYVGWAWWRWKLGERAHMAAAAFFAGGPIPGPGQTLVSSIPWSKTAQRAFTAGQAMSGILADAVTKPEPLIEAWSNEKIGAWRTVEVTVEYGDPDGLWLGFPHPDGPTDDVVTPVRHPVGVVLHAKCLSRPRPCGDVPGEQCNSGFGDGCGFYAFKTQEAARDYVTASIGGRKGIARVLLSGKVIEHDDGYRAEILEVIEIEPVAYSSLAISFEEATAAIMNLAPGWGMSAPIPPQNPFINLGGNS